MNGRETIYRGIPMRSRLEARYAARLDMIGVDWSYEPQCFADETGQYLPDFVVDRDAAALPRKFIEIKPADYPVNEMVALQRQMKIIWGTDPAAALNIVCLDWLRGPVRSLHTFGSKFEWTHWAWDTGLQVTA